MRVIAGIAKGHKLQAPEGMQTRPTTDRIKETLFNILSPDLMDCSFLDLFSGTGAIGIEALSRGAKKAVFVDSSIESRKIIDNNLSHTKLADKAVVYTNKVVEVILALGEKSEKFDIIFMDPPYKKGYVEEALKAIKDAELLNEQGYIVIEHETQGDWDNIEGFNVIKHKVYKKTTMTFVEVL